MALSNRARTCPESFCRTDNRRRRLNHYSPPGGRLRPRDCDHPIADAVTGHSIARPTLGEHPSFAFHEPAMGSSSRTMSHCCVWPSAKWTKAGAESWVRLAMPVSMMGQFLSTIPQATRWVGLSVMPSMVCVVLVAVLWNVPDSLAGRPPRQSIALPRRQLTLTPIVAVEEQRSWTVTVVVVTVHWESTEMAQSDRAPSSGPRRHGRGM